MKNQKCWSTKITKNKAIEVETYQKEVEEDNRIKTWQLTLKRMERVSHGGLSIVFEGPVRFFEIRYYDIRHWNKEEGRWMKFGEEWEKYLKERKKEESLETVIDYVNKWISRNNLEEKLYDMYGAEEIEEVISDVSKSNKFDVILDVFFALLQKKNK